MQQPYENDDGNSSAQAWRQTVQRRTATAFIQAFNEGDIPGIMSLRASDCVQQILPEPLGHPPHDNKTFRTRMESSRIAFAKYEICINSMIEDAANRRIWMHLSARGDLKAGTEYRNEYVWMLRFDESGEKIQRVDEFVGSGPQRNVGITGKEKSWSELFSRTMSEWTA